MPSSPSDSWHSIQAWSDIDLEGSFPFAVSRTGLGRILNGLASINAIKLILGAPPLICQSLDLFTGICPLGSVRHCLYDQL